MQASCTRWTGEGAHTVSMLCRQSILRTAVGQWLCTMLHFVAVYAVLFDRRGTHVVPMLGRHAILCRAVVQNLYTQKGKGKHNFQRCAGTLVVGTAVVQWTQCTGVNRHRQICS